MTKTWMLALAVTAVALAGCTGDEDPEPAGPTAEQCEAQGLELGQVERLDNDTGEHVMVPACVEPGPPATVTLVGLPASVQAYTPLLFEWVLDTPAEENHAMRTEVRFDPGVDQGACDPDAELQMPDDWGDSVAIKEHQNFAPGTSYDATFTPTEPGEYCFRGYALVQQQNIWSDVYMLNVTEVQPTGTTHTVTISPVGPLGSMDPADLTVALGDGVVWQNEDLDSYTIASTSGPESFSVAPGEEVVFLVPGSYTYEATGTFGTHDGSIAVEAPSA